MIIRVLAYFLLEIKRRERDSNPRYSYPYTHFPGVLLQPLGHLSKCTHFLGPGAVTSATPPNKTVLFMILGVAKIRK